MRATLSGAPPVRFSKTARSRPGLREAAGHPAEVGGPPAVCGRWVADDLLERPAEGAYAGEAHLEADLSDAPIGLAQEKHRPLDPSPLQVAVWCLPEGGAEGANEVRLRAVADPGQGANIERLGEVAIHRVARAEHAAVRVLGRPAHRRRAYPSRSAATSSIVRPLNTDRGSLETGLRRASASSSRRFIKTHCGLA